MVDCTVPCLISGGYPRVHTFRHRDRQMHWSFLVLAGSAFWGPSLNNFKINPLGQRALAWLPDSRPMFPVLKMVYYLANAAQGA